MTNLTNNYATRFKFKESINHMKVGFEEESIHTRECILVVHVKNGVCQLMNLKKRKGPNLSCAVNTENITIKKHIHGCVRRIRSDA